MTSEGSLSMATVNEDSAGVYRCTPANSYGSMGPSGATRVLLQVWTHWERGWGHIVRLIASLPNFRVHLTFSFKNA